MGRGKRGKGRRPGRRRVKALFLYEHEQPSQAGKLGKPPAAATAAAAAAAATAPVPVVTWLLGSLF